MAASPSCSIQRRLPRSWKYHVFLSFRGEDTRTGFTSHLYAALTRKGITTYKDDYSLRKGDVISDELLKAIEGSMFGVIVLSPNYASSTWCLDELCKILDCKNELGQHIVPVFYGVEPSDLRHHKGTFGEAFRKHEQRQDGEKVKRWRDALTQVASYSGWSSKNQNEATLVENISQSIHKILIPNLPSSMKNLVGIDSRVEQVINHIGIGLDDVRYIGICGMGGLAQKDLLVHINGSSSEIDNEYDGRRIIQASLCHKKVLLVLDDINKEKQLRNLAEDQDWFGSGSRIIITTRDMQLLKIHDAHEIYNVEGLAENEAFDLFRLKAFKQRKPEEEYLDLSNQVVKYCAGLPLALEVLGSHLYGRSIEDWHSALGKLKSFPHVDIFETLKISYDGLDSMDKDTFLDIAYFFKGYSKKYVINILERRGYHVEIGITTLMDRSLLTINNKAGWGESLEMHDLIEEMGKHIVIQESPNDPSKRSRLRCYEDIDLVLTQNKGTEATHSIVLPDNFHQNQRDMLYKKQYEVRWRDLTFSNISQLRVLVLNRLKAPIVSYIPCSLRVLRWEFCPMKTLPFIDQYYELVEIDLQNSSSIVQVWHGKKFLEKLKYLRLRNCSRLKQIPDISEAPNLEILDVEGCCELDDFPSDLTLHNSLVELVLMPCSSGSLGSKLEMSFLKELDLGRCTSLRKLPEFGECMKHLSILSLRRTAIKELPKSVGCLVGLSNLDLEGCEKLHCLPSSIGCLIGLNKLNLKNCKRLTCLPNGIQELKSLTYLNLHDCPNVYQSLHFLSGLTSLVNLNLRACFHTSQESLSYNLGHLVSLTDLDLSDNNFERVPINIHELPKLRYLNLENCLHLKVLPELPSSIRKLQARNCITLDSWNSNVISKACCGFAASTKYYPGELLQMCVTQKQIRLNIGDEISLWFVHQEQGNAVSVTLPHNETMALALCFRVCRLKWSGNHNNYFLDASVICNGKTLIKKFATKMAWDGETKYAQLLIFCFTSDYFVDQFCQDYCFELVLSKQDPIEVQSSGARWVCKEDIQRFEETKCGTET
ncbi:hypothetical protein PIB30_051311 [Stylosanthes scabra]|uniref:TIR domain-containing protein n=1 Tax=Stylosanthes scabra TaxID=79078 RepID=A0ABU6QJK8_9FABA|nr:hypothetical protein [Stylosanthes scabra]